MALVFAYMAWIACLDIWLNDYTTIALYPSHLTVTEPNYWRGDSYQLAYNAIVQLNTIIDSEGDVRWRGFVSSDGQKYRFPGHLTDYLDEVIDHLTAYAPHISVVTIKDGE
uniref:hypothetical protein n=1 Tax=Thaumasiovibrio occultus TaxID=1891184 RepID=UPI00131D0411|nr:hypothetical protein [Thaumasiovibrio occultus]